MNPDTEYQLMRDASSTFLSEVFLDQEGEAYAVVAHNGHYANVRVDSRDFQDILVRVSLEVIGRPCRSTTLKRIHQTCRAMALGNRRELHYRVAPEGESLLIDLGTRSWEAVKFEASRWAIISHPKPPFRRSGHEAPLPYPESGGEVAEILDFLPIDDPNDQVLIRVWLPLALLPHVSCWFLVFHGVRDSGKTETARVLQALVDPHTIPSLHMPSQSRDLIVSLMQHFLPVYDNLGKLRANLADILSQASTDFGGLLRKLYTDASGKSFRFRRTAIFTALEVPTDKPDWLSRCLLVRFPGGLNGLGKSDLWRRFEQVRPRIFGAMLDSLSHALQIEKDLPAGNDSDLGRFRDWNRIGLACALAQGISESQFRAALREAVSRQRRQVTNNQPIAKAILELMEHHTIWKGSPTQLFRDLEPIAELERLDKDPSWPKYVATMGKALLAIVPELRAEGIEIQQEQRGKNRDRYYIIRKTAKEPDHLRLVGDHHASTE